MWGDIGYGEQCVRKYRDGGWDSRLWVWGTQTQGSFLDEKMDLSVFRTRQTTHPLMWGMGAETSR